MSWQWLNTVNRVNTQVKKVRSSCAGMFILLLTGFACSTIDFDSLLCHHSSCLEHHRRGLVSAGKASGSLYCQGGDHPAIRTRTNARLRFIKVVEMQFEDVRAS